MPARPLIWPLLDRLNRTVAFQCRPKSSANLGLVRLPALPWDESDRPGTIGYGQVEGVPSLAEFRPWNFGLAKLGLQAIRLQDFKTNPRALLVSQQRRVPAVIHVNPPSRVVTITGITRDSTGAILGSCVVELYDTVTNLPMMQATSDATTGIYQFTCAKLPPGQHYVVAYKVGSPDRAGTTLNTLVGA